MKRLLIPAIIALASLSSPLAAEAIAEHTFLLAWASKNCEGFTYAPDLLRHALAEVQSAPRAEVEALAGEVIGGLHALHEGDMAEMCDTAIFLIENPEEE